MPRYLGEEGGWPDGRDCRAEGWVDPGPRGRPRPPSRPLLPPLSGAGGLRGAHSVQPDQPRGHPQRQRGNLVALARGTGLLLLPQPAAWALLLEPPVTLPGGQGGQGLPGAFEEEEAVRAAAGPHDGGPS